MRHRVKPRRLPFGFFIAFLFLASPLHATDVFVGGKIGPGVSLIYGTDAWNYEAPAAVMSLNAFLTIRVWDYLAIQPELAYEMKGYQRLATEGVPTERFHYVSLMLLFKGFFDEEGFELQPYAGAEVAFLQKAESMNGPFSEDISSDIRWYDVGVVFGFEVFFPLPVEQLYITGDIRAEVGVLDFDIAGAFPPADSSSIIYRKNSTYADKKNIVCYALVGMAYRF